MISMLQPLEELERIAIEEQVSRLSEAIEKYYTELILKRVCFDNAVEFFQNHPSHLL